MKPSSQPVAKAATMTSAAMRQVPVHPKRGDQGEREGRQDRFAGRKAEGRHAERAAAHAFMEARGAHHARMAEHALAEEAQARRGCKSEHEEIRREGQAERGRRQAEAWPWWHKAGCRPGRCMLPTQIIRRPEDRVATRIDRAEAAVREAESRADIRARQGNEEGLAEGRQEGQGEAEADDAPVMR